KTDRSVTVAGPMLRRGAGVISDDNLPVDVRVDEYMKNSSLLRVTGGNARGMRDVFITADDKQYKLVPQDEGNGVDVEQQEEAAAAGVTFLRKGTQQVLGTYLVSLWFYPNFTMDTLLFPPQRINVDGKTYTVELRYKRAYKPYDIRLDKF